MTQGSLEVSCAALTVSVMTASTSLNRWQSTSGRSPLTLAGRRRLRRGGLVSGEFTLVEVVEPVDDVEDEEYEGEHDAAHLVDVLGPLEVLLLLPVPAGFEFVGAFFAVLLLTTFPISLQAVNERGEEDDVRETYTATWNDEKS